MPYIDPNYRFATYLVVSDGVTSDYEIAFDGGYIHQEDVVASSYILDETGLITDRTAHTVTFLSEGTDPSTGWQTAQVRISPIPAAGRFLTIERNTNISASLVDYVSASILTDKNLDLANKQSILAIAEIHDKLADLALAVDDRVGDALSLIGDAVDAAEDATTAAEDAAATASAAAATASAAAASANALRLDLADTAPDKGAELVGFKQSGVGMVARDLMSKNRDVVHADDRGLLGDASDETTGLQDMFDAAAGKVLMLGAGKTYGIGAGGITIPANTTLISNGSKFKKLVANTTYGITVGDAAIIDRLTLDIVGGAGVQDAGIQIKSNNGQFGHVKVTALTAGATPSDPLAGIYVGLGTGVAISNLHFGRLETSGIQVPIILDTVNSLRIEWAEIPDFKRGIYIKDCKRFVIAGGSAPSIAVGATGSAGQNAILVESATADRSCADGTIENFISGISPEHGFRIGGQFIASGIKFKNCTSKLAGSGSAPAGGCGIKVLGPTSVPSYHEAIVVDGMVIEDASNVSGENHHIADFGLVDGLSVNGLIGRKRTRTYSGYGGLRLSKLKNADIHANVTDTNIGALRFKEDAGFAGMVAMDNVRISGVFDTGGATSDVISMDCLDTIYRNVSINGATVSGGRAATRIEAPAGAGAYTTVSMTFDYLQQDTVQAALTGAASGSILYNVRALWGGTPTAKDGSIYQDFTNQLVRIRKAGAWTSL